jgi:hypothetical protein
LQALESLLQNRPDNIRWRQWRIRMQSTASTLLVRLAETDPSFRPLALPALRLAHRYAQDDVDRNPGDNRLLDLETVMADRLARYLGDIGRPVEGLAAVAESRANVERLVGSNPQLARIRILEENVWQLRGRLLTQAHHVEEAERVLAEADRLTVEATSHWPADVTLLDDRTTTLSYRVTTAMKRGDWSAARERCRLALALAATMRARHSDYPVEALADLQHQARELGLP